MHTIDWLIIGIPILIIFAVAAKAQRHVKNVSDYMTGRRAAGRFLLTFGEMSLILLIASVEMTYNNGWVNAGPYAGLAVPLAFTLTLMGYLIYRYRETRVMTIAQLFEIRYSKNFRIFAGILSVAAGIIQYGIFPAVAGRFFMYFCELPEKIPVFSASDPIFFIPTFALLMFIFLVINLSLLLPGGQLTLMIIDTIQSYFCYIMLSIVVVTVFVLVSPSEVIRVLENQQPGKSFVNPWDISKFEDFNIWFWLIGMVGAIYSMMAWQNTTTINSCAANPHEAKMGRILYTFRRDYMWYMFCFIIMGALVYMHHPSYAAQSSTVNKLLSQIDNQAVRTQMSAPLAISHFLPIGVKGCFASVMLLLMIVSEMNNMQSWGSVFIQDCILPFRTKAFKPERQMLYLRLACAGVAVFAFFFSLLFYQTTYILMFFALTGTIYLGGAGSCIVGGLYWKKGTAAGAWGAMLSGAGLAILGFIGDQYWKSMHPFFVSWFPESIWIKQHADKFPINGQWIWGIAMVTAIFTYIIVSLLTCRQNFNMDRMLHRGKYAVDADGNPLPREEDPPFTWKTFIGIDPYMTRSDKRLVYYAFFYNYFFWAVGIVVLIWNIIPGGRWSDRPFTLLLLIGLCVQSLMIFPLLVWFTWGGLRDMKNLFKALETHKSNVFDDGRVVDSHNAGETMEEKKEAKAG